MDQTVKERLTELSRLDFSGRAEAFVESKFLTPLLELLGYDQHKDYEVLRHGDDASSFKINYPVEKGAVRVKHYNPDYMPTIRKKIFWIIEAKSPKNVSYPFNKDFLVQGLQYCIHPEIQAKYLIVSNGSHTAVYDAHGGVFLEGDVYAEVLMYKHSELLARWPEIFNLLSVEKIRERLEDSFRTMFDKLALASLDENYPRKLAASIFSKETALKSQIRKNVTRLYMEKMDRGNLEYKQFLESLPTFGLLHMMEFPAGSGKVAGQYYVDAALKEGKSLGDIFKTLTDDFEKQSIIRKEQTYIAVCEIVQRLPTSAIATDARQFLGTHKSEKFSLLNLVECASMRVVRKLNVVKAYPNLRKRIAEDMKTLPEIERFVNPPSALSVTWPMEQEMRLVTFEGLKKMSIEQLEELLKKFAALEKELEIPYKEAAAKLSGHEKQILDWAYYGVGDTHFAFENIIKHFGIEL